MEAAGVLQCFQESLDIHKVRITNFIGDGDSKSHAGVIKADPYPGVVVKKLECVGHVQKRCGSRLQNLKKQCKEKIIINEKPLLVLQKLTHKFINKLQNCYGIAIRQNCPTGDVNVMRKVVGAVLYHYSEANDPASQHQCCPQGGESWCKYQADLANGATTYVHKSVLPVYVREKIKPIFQDLGSEELLSKCLHGTTQNNNEALNGVIWQKCPKEVYVERFTLEIGVCSAVINFNSGSPGIIKVLENCGISPGHFTKLFCEQKDRNRVANMNRKSTGKVKLIRKKLLARRKGYADKHLETEGVTYGAGKF